MILTSQDTVLIASKRRALIDDLSAVGRLSALELKRLIVEDLATHDPEQLRERVFSELGFDSLTKALRNGAISVTATEHDHSGQTLSDLRVINLLRQWLGWSAFERIIVTHDRGCNVDTIEPVLKPRDVYAGNPRLMMYAYRQAMAYCHLGYYLNRGRLHTLFVRNEGDEQLRMRFAHREASYGVSLYLLKNMAPMFFNLYNKDRGDLLGHVEHIWNFSDEKPDMPKNYGSHLRDVIDETEWDRGSPLPDLCEHLFVPDFMIEHHEMQDALDAMMKLLNFKRSKHA